MYDPTLARWTTTDPLMEKYYSFSPYNYCIGNPAIYKDPTGKDVVIWYQDEQGKYQSFRYTDQTDVSNAPLFVKQTIMALRYNIQNGGGDPSIEAVSNNKIIINIVETSKESVYYNNYVYWNPLLGSKHENATVSPATVLDHEIDHAIISILNPKEYRAGYRTKDDNYSNNEEKRVITGSEQKTAKANGEINPGAKFTRTNHKGKYVVTLSPISNKIDKIKTKIYENNRKKNEIYSFSTEW